MEVSAPSLNVREGPGTSFPRIAKVPGGQQLTVVARDAEGGWLQVCCLDGQMGWVSSGFVTHTQDLAGVPTAVAIPSPPVSKPLPSPQSVTVRETTISIPTYPYEQFLTHAVDPDHGNFPLRVLDRSAYEASNPLAEAKAYRLVVLENEYLRVELLPELGGRVYGCVFKPTGNDEFYRNPVIKPTHWGPMTVSGANWWLAAGGLEWGLPVQEHGYEWGFPWQYRIDRADDGSVAVHLWDGDEPRLRARVAVALHPGQASFGLTIRLENPADRAVSYQFWSNGMLAPGGSNRLSGSLEFVFPASDMTVHSTSDQRMPGEGRPFTWPFYGGRNVSRLDTWQGYLGFFQRPAAQGGFVGAYNHAADEGIVRVYPTDVARGAKGFGVGWGVEAIPNHNWTDDDSGYVELHGGVTPTFWDWASLDAGQSLEWTETWFPIAGVGGLLHAERGGAVNVQLQPDGLLVGVYPTRRMTGQLIVRLDNQQIYEADVRVAPDEPLTQVVPLPAGAPERGFVEVGLVDPVSGHHQVSMPATEMALR